MLAWRTTQLASQNPVNALTTFTNRTSYALKEAFTSPLLLPLALISVVLLALTSPSFTTISLLNLVVFVLILPTRWNRYLLPIMPAIAIYLGNLPSLMVTIFKKIKDNFTFIKQFGTGAVVGLLIIALFLLLPITNYLSFVVLFISIFLIIQGFLVTRSMLYGFSHRSPATIPSRTPKYGFSLIVPARDEPTVIGATIQTLASLNYPQDLYEILVMIRADDYATINAANIAIVKCGVNNIRLIQIDGDADNKSYSLNLGLHLAKHDIIGIFDAEDEPHLDILTRVNDYLCTHPHVGAVQAPVHLTNLNSSWFSSLSAIEYYYWFASVLPYLSTKGIVPLGGNTIFTKKEIYQQLGTYDESCLTEDADLGIRLATHHIPVGIITEASLATREESPQSEMDVIRQRSRWDQGYLQVLDKSNWISLNTTQKFYTLYTLTQPIFRHLSFLNMIFTPLLATFGHISLWLALLSFIPSYFLLLQLGLYLLGLAELARLHHVKVSFWRYISTLLAFVPYQALLTLATLRALGKMFVGNYSWDKTSHTNSHRSGLAILEA
jgi:cellulose synthase/poly-beta-1,6-N-acetylglucosamine synthase-like glycosyltransferase